MQGYQGVTELQVRRRPDQGGLEVGETTAPGHGGISAGWGGRPALTCMNAPAGWHPTFRRSMGAAAYQATPGLAN